MVEIKRLSYFNNKNKDNKNNQNINKNKKDSKNKEIVNYKSKKNNGDFKKLNSYKDQEENEQINKDQKNKDQNLQNTNSSNKIRKLKKLVLFNKKISKDKNIKRSKKRSKNRSKKRSKNIKNSLSDLEKIIKQKIKEQENNQNLKKEDNKKSKKDQSIIKININKKKVENITSLLENLENKVKKINKEKEPFIEQFSFLEDRPKVSRIKLDNYKVKNLYSKIDEIKKKSRSENKNDNNQKENEKKDYLVEEFNVPEIIALKDTDSSKLPENKFISREIENEKDHEFDSNFEIKNNNLVLNPKLKDKMKTIDENKKNTTLNIPHFKGSNENIDLSNKKENKEKEKNKDLPYSDLSKEYNKNSKKKKDIDYILPRDYDKKQEEKENNIDFNFVQQQGTNYSNLVYNIKPKTDFGNIEDVYEKYNIDEFTYVTISYQNNSLYYKLVQPELTSRQSRIYSKIKQSFLNSIDRNYYSFKGDKYNIRKYIHKIFDIVVDKLNYSLSSVDKDLYLSFIEKDFTGLGFLNSILNDKNIIELRCSGANTPISVYHIKYGNIPTNLKFEKISKLNIFVLSLTKLMSLHVNSNNPVFNGYLPSGYKVEGLYSIGDISNKGSSFVIKKYLDKPQSPSSLINTGVGSVDIFAYIWSMIDKEYEILITGEDHTNFILNSLCLFYPNKQITTLQEQDNLKLPQKDWIKRTLLDSNNVDLKTLLDQSISEKPDFIVVEDFKESYFTSKWYDINMLTINKTLLDSFINKAKNIEKPLVIIDLDRLKIGSKELIQFREIKELTSNKLYTILKLDENNNTFKFNLLSSEIDILEFRRKKEILNWILNSKIYDYEDFNNIVNDYYLDKDKLFDKLGIVEKEKNNKK